MKYVNSSGAFRHAAHALLIAALAASGARGQAVTVAAGASFETYSFADPAAAGVKRVSLLTLPFGAAFRPASWLGVSVSSAVASGSSVRPDDSKSTISGLTDTAIQLSIPVSADRVTLAATVMLPTGKSTYTTEEAQVAGLIAADLLPFRLSNWGGGGSVDLSSAFTVPVGGLNLGARVGYQVGREFDLLEGSSFAYRPGNQLYVRLAADGNVGAGKLAAQLNVYRFGDDQVNSLNLYRSGNRLQGLLSYTGALGRSASASVYGGAMRRQHGNFLDGSGDTPAQTMFLFGGGLRKPLSMGILVPSIDMRLLRSSDGIGQGYIAGVGASLEMPMSNGSLTLLPTARARFGKLLVRDGSESGITGFELGAGLRFGRPRS